MKKQITTCLTFSVLISLILFSEYRASFSQERAESKAIFYVKWYDVGKEALEGLKGVTKVENSFRNLKEINTVYYEPKVISIEEMELVLKKAGTYIETLK